MKTIIHTSVALFSLLMLFSCKGPGLFDRFDVHPSSIYASAYGGDFKITSDPFDQVYILVDGKSFETERFTGQSDGKSYSVSGGWLSVSFTPENGKKPTTVKVVVEKNLSGSPREATIIVSNIVDGDGRVTVKQEMFYE